MNFDGWLLLTLDPRLQRTIYEGPKRFVVMRFNCIHCILSIFWMDQNRSYQLGECGGYVHACKDWWDAILGWIWIAFSEKSRKNDFESFPPYAGGTNWKKVKSEYVRHALKFVETSFSHRSVLVFIRSRSLSYAPVEKLHKNSRRKSTNNQYATRTFSIR